MLILMKSQKFNEDIYIETDNKKAHPEEICPLFYAYEIGLLDALELPDETISQMIATKKVFSGLLTWEGKTYAPEPIKVKPQRKPVEATKERNAVMDLVNKRKMVSKDKLRLRDD